MNRYAGLKPNTLAMLNQIKRTDEKINEELTTHILKELLNEKGVRLAMASTILRFKNPNIYQIIDQRAYRILCGNQANYDATSIDEQIKIYLDYLRKLKQDCLVYNIAFHEADRKLYSLDKRYNSKLKLRNYGI